MLVIKRYFFTVYEVQPDGDRAGVGRAAAVVSALASAHALQRQLRHVVLAADAADAGGYAGDRRRGRGPRCRGRRLLLRLRRRRLVDGDEVEGGVHAGVGAGHQPAGAVVPAKEVGVSHNIQAINVLRRIGGFFSPMTEQTL